MQMMKKPASLHSEGCDCAQCMAKGGKVELKAEEAKDEGPKDGGEDSELHEAVGHEIMEAIHSKDHKKLMQGIEAIVLSHLSKKEDADA